MHLPSYYTKRKLYEQFCYVSGWEIKAASDGPYPPFTQFSSRKNVMRVQMTMKMKEACHYGQMDTKHYLCVVGTPSYKSERIIFQI